MLNSETIEYDLRRMRDILLRFYGAVSSIYSSPLLSTPEIDGSPFLSRRLLRFLAIRLPTIVVGEKKDAPRSYNQRNWLENRSRRFYECRSRECILGASLRCRFFFIEKEDERSMRSVLFIEQIRDLEIIKPSFFCES